MSVEAPATGTVQAAFKLCRTTDTERSEECKIREGKAALKQQLRFNLPNSFFLEAFGQPTLRLLPNVNLQKGSKLTVGPGVVPNPDGDTWRWTVETGLSWGATTEVKVGEGLEASGSVEDGKAKADSLLLKFELPILWGKWIWHGSPELANRWIPAARLKSSIIDVPTEDRPPGSDWVVQGGLNVPLGRLILSGAAAYGPGGENVDASAWSAGFLVMAGADRNHHFGFVADHYAMDGASPEGVAANGGGQRWDELARTEATRLALGYEHMQPDEKGKATARRGVYLALRRQEGEHPHAEGTNVGRRDIRTVAAWSDITPIGFARGSTFGFATGWERYEQEFEGGSGASTSIDGTALFGRLVVPIPKVSALQVFFEGGSHIVVGDFIERQREIIALIGAGIDLPKIPLWGQ